MLKHRLRRALAMLAVCATLIGSLTVPASAAFGEVLQNVLRHRVQIQFCCYIPHAAGQETGEAAIMLQFPECSFYLY